MENDFQNKTVVITGASAGLGRAMVREFAKHGANIGLIARGIDGLNAAKKEVEDLGGEALIVPADVSHANEVENAARKIDAEEFRVAASILILRCLQRDAVHRTDGGTEIAGNAALPSIRIA